MAKMKELVIYICEAYDYEGLTIVEIANRFEMTEEVIIKILSDYSEWFSIGEK